MAYQLRNEQLVVNIAKLGEPYRGSRFEWAGFITGIKLLRGNHTFCVEESRTPGEGTGGQGLCSEFGITKPVGYDEAKAGDLFPKLGIGLLTRPDEAEYQFFREYQIDPFEVEVRQVTDQAIEFVSLPRECLGYAAKIVKTISIEDNQLKIEYTLHNTGEKPIRTEEYCHNFLGIDNHPVGPDYSLKLPIQFKPWSDEAETMEDLVFTSSDVTWKRQPAQPFYFRLPGFDGSECPWLWEMLHRPSGVGIRELSKFSVASAAVWGIGHVISPEMFIEVNVEPGLTKTWSRVYEFFTD